MAKKWVFPAQPAEKDREQRSTPNTGAAAIPEKKMPKAMTPQRTEKHLRERAEVLKLRLTKQTVGKTRGSAPIEQLSN
eukprot:5323789-Amphidinium_carterae.1